MADLFKFKQYKLTPEEQSVIDYHRRHLQLGTGLHNEDGTTTTFRGAIVGTPEGELLFPTYWNGAVREIPDAMRLMGKSGIRFPTYKSIKEAEQAEKRLHDIMESDVQQFYAPHPK
jgi:hypothetical protein